MQNADLYSSHELSNLLQWLCHDAVW